MSRMFSYAKLFRGDISKWDVSNVRDMSGMFHRAESFNSHLSKWDVSRVTNMLGMFQFARSYNGDISKWDVSRVSNMDNMFRDAIFFQRRLCGAAWVHSQARKTAMFAGSSGSISRTVCTTTPAAFVPQSKKELFSAVATYLKLSPKGYCSDQKMDGKKRDNISIGLEVEIVEKRNQRTRKLTHGFVARILTNSRQHPHGIKVKLKTGEVGRVKNILGSFLS